MVFDPYSLPKGHPDADENLQARRSLIDIAAAMLLYFRRPRHLGPKATQSIRTADSETVLVVAQSRSLPLNDMLVSNHQRPKTSLDSAHEWQDRLSAGTLEKQPMVAAYQPRKFVLPGGEKKIDMRLIKPKPLSRTDWANGRE
ncbi:hypothetical protein CPLU01_08131 [Colletotrichum plurivorum]|uniref:Uncharacterized protein n=1 Tax=Colletotrichum plurivorum TaxID=2175906 RepID=A0A8H6KDU4_9PEZI|nr:hypothetical protein CPLU01_08131 [Colletotrichum plurivorum]